ncbi:ECF-type sigma factor [Tumebacillus permanentifrigoris]|uniref:ECF sigma factor n=1 Tax=Tumebacillus permanentifrigoris TaxID=378543 RepID=A0A316D2T0_9BACL|nr:ECF-type sigma factor [Tumebacillus permanentifrigoris]PWK05253.1 ECF sigma factor [Tumebacillus permanentifrigoris]
MSVDSQYEEIKRQVVAVLTEYPKLNAYIAAQESMATGEIVRAPAHLFGSHIEHLATVGRVYTIGMAERNGRLQHSSRVTKTGTQIKRSPRRPSGVTKSQAENYFAAQKADDKEDQDALNEIVEIFIGLEPRGKDGVLDPLTGRTVVTKERAMLMATEEAARLRSLKTGIEDALERLKTYAPRLVLLLQLRYFVGKTTEEVAAELEVSRRQQDILHRKAITEMGRLLGIAY